MKMTNLLVTVASVMVIALLISCVSLEDKKVAPDERNTSKIIGSVSTEFTSFQFFHVIGKEKLKNKAYTRLLEKARAEYGPDVDIRNIKIEGSFSYWEILNLLAIPAGIGIGYGIGRGVGDAISNQGIGQGEGGTYDYQQGKKGLGIGLGIGIPIGVTLMVDPETHKK